MALVQAPFQIKEEEECKLLPFPKPKNEEAADGGGELVLFQNPKREERAREAEAANGSRPRIHEEDQDEDEDDDEEEKEGDEFRRRRRRRRRSEEEEGEEEEGNKKPKGYLSTCDWSAGAVDALLDSYSPKFCLGKGFLRGNDWEEVLRDVNDALPSSSRKTMKQCKDKVDSLKRRYKVEKRKAVNGAVVSWPFFNQLDQMMSSVLRQGKLFDPRHEKLPEPDDPKPRKLFDPRHGGILECQQGKLLEPYDPRPGGILECQQGKLLEPYDPRQGKLLEPYDPSRQGKLLEPYDLRRQGMLLEPYDSRQGKLFEPYECRQGNCFRPFDSMQGKFLQPCDPVQGNLFEACDSNMQGKLLPTCDSRRGKLFEPYDFRHQQLLNPRLSNGFGCDPSAYTLKNTFQNGKSLNEEGVIERGVKHRNLIRKTGSSRANASDSSPKTLQMQSASLHVKKETNKKHKIPVNKPKMRLLEEVASGFSDVFERIEAAKRQIFTKMKEEMAKLRKMKKRHKTPSSSNCGSSR